MSKIIELKNVNKWFDKFQVLKDIDLEVAPQEKIVICGPSGSGKSTFLHMLALLEEPNKGKIYLSNSDTGKMSESEKDKVRRDVVEWLGSMENLVKNNVKRAFWKGKRVLITGHTGFKGSWLSLWLQTLGAQVYGFGLEDVGSTYLYSELNLRERLVSSRYGDIRSKALVDLALEEAAPDIVFHIWQCLIVPVHGLHPSSEPILEK